MATAQRIMIDRGSKSHEDAANDYVRREYPPRRGVLPAFALRVTGERGKSGMFRPYRRVEKGSAISAIGDAFHVS